MHVTVRRCWYDIVRCPRSCASPRGGPFFNTCHSVWEMEGAEAGPQPRRGALDVKAKKKLPRTRSPLAGGSPGNKKTAGKKAAGKQKEELPLSSSRGDRFRAAGSGNGSHTGPAKAKGKTKLNTLAEEESAGGEGSVAMSEMAMSEIDVSEPSSMEAAEVAAQRIFDMAARQTPPWSCAIAERDDGRAFARVSVKAVLDDDVLTLVAQVRQKKGGLKFFRREGEQLLADISTSDFPYDEESLEENWVDG